MDPPLERKRRSTFTDDSYNLADNTAASGADCKDRNFTGADVPPSMASFSFETYWETISHTVSEDFYIEVRTKKPRRASDKVSRTVVTAPVTS